MAHLSKDEDFIDAFVNGEDIHSRTAREILTNGSAVTDEDRRKAKAINFGILYGLSEYGLSKQLSIPRKEAAAYIQAYFARYPKIREFLDRTIDDAKVCGYVTTIRGRRRYLPDLNNKNRNIRMGAERVAMNTPIQGSAADLIKLAMIEIAKFIKAEQLKSKLIMQVHDELVFECPDDELDRVEKNVRELMATAVKLDVPLVVDMGRGQNWNIAH